MHTKNTHHWTVVFCKVAITNATHVMHIHTAKLYLKKTVPIHQLLSRNMCIGYK